MKETITIRLPEDLLKELEELSTIEQRSKSEIIRNAVSRYLSVIRFKKIRKTILPFAEAQGLLTDEDIFKAIS